MAKKNNQKLLAVLIDPEKIQINQICSFVSLINQSIVTHIFVGGSTDKNNSIEEVVLEIKKHTILPIILFPGSHTQVTSKADGILFLSLISGRNLEYLINQQIKAAFDIQKSNLEVIPTGYVLINGGKETSVERISQTKPIAETDTELIVKTALAGQFMGKKLIYLEAGSGALQPVAPTTIQLVSENLSIPVIVGGGIKDLHQLSEAHNSGADLVVIGTAFEKDSLFFKELKKENINENIC